MKRTCNGCKAIITTISHSNACSDFGCEFGYETRRGECYTNSRTSNTTAFIGNQYPCEPCPKPKTNKKYVEVYQNNTNFRYNLK